MSVAGRPEVCEVELGAAVDNVFALALALLLIEDDENRHGVSPADMATARDRLTYKLYLQSQELKNLVDTGSIHGAEPVAAAATGGA